MEDAQIVDLYWQRSDEAIPQTEIKYGRYCRTVAKVAPSRFKGLMTAPWQLAVPVMRPFFDQAFDQMPEAKKAMDDWLRVS